MRASVALAAVVACAYPEPADRCDGYCSVYAIDRPIATPGTLITLEGTFDKDSVVNFPGSSQRQPLVSFGSHRATVRVPDDAGTGNLFLQTNSNTTDDFLFRTTTFTPTLQPFRDHYDQTDGGRYLGANINFERAGATVVRHGKMLYVIGGASSAGFVATVDAMIAGADDSITEPQPTNAALKTGRSHHASLVIGPYVYAIGGLATGGATPSVEGATINETGTLGAFDIFSDVRLTVAREGLAATIVGNYVYVVGGKNETGDLATLERAPIYESGLLGTFESLPGFALRTPRSGHTLAVAGDSLYVIGGFSAGVPVAQTERIPLFGDAFIGEPVTAGDLKAARGYHTSVIVGDSLYVIGGRNATVDLTSVERATLGTTLAWETAPALELQQARSSGMLAVVGNHIYVMGGTSANAHLARFERASIIGRSSTGMRVTIEDFAEATPKLRTPRTLFTTLVLGNHVYVIGGNTGNGATQVIERATVGPDGTLSDFEFAGELDEPRYAHASFIFNNRYYVVGGANNLGTRTTISAADIVSDGTLGTFAPVAFTLDQPRFFHDIIVVGYTAYVLAGITGSADPFTTLDTTASSSLITGGNIPTFVESAPAAFPAPRSGSVPVVLGTQAYLFAGANKNAYTPGVAAAITGSGLGPWVNTAGPSGRESAGMVVLGDAVFAIGGGNINSAPRTDRADITGDAVGTFSAITTGILRTPRFGHATLVIGNRVYAIGGHMQSTSGAISAFSSVEMATIR